MKRILLLIVPFLFFVFAQQRNDSWREKAANPENLHAAIKQLTDVMVHDIYAPPVASRTYAYIAVAGYEAARHQDSAYLTLAGQLHDLKPFLQPDSNQQYSFPLSAITAILTVGKTMVISEEKIDAFYNKLLQQYKTTGMPPEVFDASVAYGKAVAAHVLAWAAKDQYQQTRTMPKYDLSTDDALWRPTPPAYMKAVEPHWSRIRPFLIDSAQQFKPARPTPFSKDKTSRFYKEAKAVHDVGLKLTPEQKAIASFWDCNPFKMNVNGHVMFATKKISPGGHWINITGLACKKKNASFVKSAEAYACVALAMADGFISCWDEKYRSNVVRPETYINQHINPAWMPLLQTPPFPEYTSGHSVVSTTSAIMLTKLFGDGFAFADSTEVEFGLPVRHFTSFKQAADEAAISRFYGGIHYKPSIVNGVAEGAQIGKFYLQKLQTRKN